MSCSPSDARPSIERVFVEEGTRAADHSPASSDPSELPLEHLEHEICELASRIYASSCRWLELVAEFDRRKGWWAWEGTRSTADWLAWKCALGTRAAREQVRVARALAELPGIHGAFAWGELSYSKVRALTRVATAESEAELLELARHATAAQLERLIGIYRRGLPGRGRRGPPRHLPLLALGRAGDARAPRPARAAAGGAAPAGARVRRRCPARARPGGRGRFRGTGFPTPIG
jgi:Domain of unknown function (DUF222)